jgi:hypothetical protein
LQNAEEPIAECQALPFVSKVRRGRGGGLDGPGDGQAGPLIVVATQKGSDESLSRNHSFLETLPAAGLPAAGLPCSHTIFMPPKSLASKLIRSSTSFETVYLKQIIIGVVV